MYTVYILYSEKFDSFYIGYTSDIKQRLEMHNSGRTKSTKSKIPWKVMFTEVFENRIDAIRREKFLKDQKNKQFYKRLCGMEE